MSAPLSPTEAALVAGALRSQAVAKDRLAAAIDNGRARDDSDRSVTAWSLRDTATECRALAVKIERSA